MSWHTFLFECRLNVALVFRCGNRYLVSFRKNCKVFSGRWQFIGGGIERGECAAAAAARECWEESGVHVDPNHLRPLGLSVVRDPEEGQAACQFFMLELVDVDVYKFIDKEPEKHSPWEWVNADELLRRELMPGMRDVILKDQTNKG